MRKYLEHYYKKYPNSTIRDFVKLVYQATFGPEHMITNPAKSLVYLKDEMASLTPHNFEFLYDVICEDFARINLRVYKQYNLSINLLNEIFQNSANLFLPHPKDFKTELNILKDFLIEKDFKKEEIELFLNEYESLGYPALSHSDFYRQHYKPAYRVIHKNFLTEEINYYQLTHYFKNFSHDKINFIALEGKTCSGKTTLASLLKKESQITIIHVDDFFDGASESIGINSKRIITEIFQQACLNKPLVYRKWDCTLKKYKEVTIDKVKPIVLIEGVYSANPELENFYQGIIYIHINEEEQINRLVKRSKPLLHRFINEWIPRENKYFNKFNIDQKADLIILE